MIPRVIPCLLIQDGKLVKTVQFRKPTYVGDPVNAIRIFNDKEVDELAVLDISANRESRGPDFELLSEIGSECFMPISYGGGLRTIPQIARLFKLGVEKAILNSIVAEQPALVTEAADIFGSSSIVVSMDVRKNWRGKYRVVTRNGANVVSNDPVEYARGAATLGAGELLVTAVDREGMMGGFDTGLISMISTSVDIPVVANGGAFTSADLRTAVVVGGASAVAAGSMFVFHGPHKAVLISFPSRASLELLFDANHKDH